MKIDFFKYHGNGNDFIIIDNRDKLLNIDKKKIIYLCDRNIGIGSDGLILIEKDDKMDFFIKYYNSNGNLGSLCGNGSRCSLLFVKNMGLVKKKYHFRAFDGIHKGFIDKKKMISIKIRDIKFNDIYFNSKKKCCFLDTGSPHYVLFNDNVDKINVNKLGKKIRNSPLYYKKGGVNVNFVEIINDKLLKIRTYERGVESETFSCGTGAVASAIAFNYCFRKKETLKNKELINELLTNGGKLFVSFNINKNGFYEKIFLKGPAIFVFKGKIYL